MHQFNSMLRFGPLGPGRTFGNMPLEAKKAYENALMAMNDKRTPKKAASQTSNADGKRAFFAAKEWMKRAEARKRDRDQRSKGSR